MLPERQPHARAADIPGWPCPHRVRDFPTGPPTAWGHIYVGGNRYDAAVAIDELGLLWVRGDVAPQFRIPDDDLANPGALLYRTAAEGIGIWFHPKSLWALPSVSRLDMTNGQEADLWLPVNEVASTMPSFIAPPTADRTPPQA